MNPPREDEPGEDEQFTRPYGRHGRETASYRELRDMEARLREEVRQMERAISQQIGTMEREQDRKLAEIAKETGKRLEDLGKTVGDMEAGSRWMRSLTQVILTVFGTAIGGGLLYLLKLPGNPTGGDSVP